MTTKKFPIVIKVSYTGPHKRYNETKNYRIISNYCKEDIIRSYMKVSNKLKLDFISLTMNGYGIIRNQRAIEKLYKLNLIKESDIIVQGIRENRINTIFLSRSQHLRILFSLIRLDLKDLKLKRVSK